MGRSKPSTAIPGRPDETLKSGFCLDRVARSADLTSFLGQALHAVAGYENVRMPRRSAQQNHNTSANVPIIHKKEITDNIRYLGYLTKDRVRLHLGQHLESLTEDLTSRQVISLHVAPSSPRSPEYVVLALLDEETDGQVWAERETATSALAELAGVDPSVMRWSSRESGFVVATVTPGVKLNPAAILDAPQLNTDSPKEFATDLAAQLQQYMGFAVTLHSALPSRLRQSV